ncbi:MAG: YcaO-like family protein [Deltaproteobacteria bacterium]|nr:YcaO-like family protein [Deltaproteobacteria bacterium]
MTEPIVLDDAFKQYTADQDKVMDPRETVEKFRRRLREIDLDILDKTERIDNGRLGIPVFFSKCGRDAASIIGTKKQMGKGATPQQAEASAVMELAERFSFFSFCKNPNNFFTDTYTHLKNDALPFEAIARSVHDDSSDLEITRNVFENLPLSWTWAYNLTRREKVLIPFSWFFAINEFNGPSAGNCREEALCQGICEIVERHVSSLISRNRMPVPLIEPASADDPAVVDMLAKYHHAGIHVYLSDFTLDMGIPSVGVLAYDPRTFPEKSEIVWTAGTTPDPQKALSRALTETAQLAGDFNSGSNYVASGLPKFTNLADAAYVTGAAQTVALADLPDISDNNIRVEVENSIAALAERDLEVIVIDTMHDRLRIPSFYTIVPGAHFRERAAGTSVGMFAAKLISENQSPGEAFRQLQEIDNGLPGKYYLSFYLGKAMLDMGENQKALDLFNRSLDLDPARQDMASIYSYMGVSLKEMGAFEEALDVLKKGEALDRERTDIYNLMGFCHFKLKQHEQAIEAFARVLELNPGSAIDYANIGSNYREMGEYEKAAYFYEIALSIDPGIDFARESLAKLKKA